MPEQPAVDARTEAVAAWLYGHALRRGWLANTPTWLELDEAMKPEWRADAAELLRVAAGEHFLMPPPDAA